MRLWSTQFRGCPIVADEHRSKKEFRFGGDSHKPPLNPGRLPETLVEDRGLAGTGADGRRGFH